MATTKISLESKKMKPVVDQLNDLLANYHIHYQKLRGCHWNVQGGHFFTLHAKFEELYNNALTAIDEFAERVLTLGKSPYSNFSDYLKVAEIKEINTIGMKDIDMVKAILQDLEMLIAMQRDLLEVTSEAGDEGTNDLINAQMQFNEKQHWMLLSFTK
ncbi:MAG TPA: DNA starvation/stationary phase protection protein [Sphingobacteriaceae bacterium]|nr:DNA starvation/stationary phase protection protein [Sphingobacteriaceae bacterium]